VLVINSAGVMQFMNARLEKLLGYNKDILGRNISCIMPEPYSSAHDTYLRSYLRAGAPKVIGRGGRVVVAKHANGSVVPIQLEVDECIVEGQRYFVGCLQPKDATRKKKTTLLERTRLVVDQLACPSIVINPTGTILAFNQAASVAFGYEATEVITKNVRMLMNDTEAAKHDGYLQRHMQTGENRAINKFTFVMAKVRRWRCCCWRRCSNVSVCRTSRGSSLRRICPFPRASTPTTPITFSSLVQLSLSARSE
jgi:PAS domain S-box-containing protein